MRTGWLVSLCRKTSTGRMPTGSGLALPNLSLAAAASVQGLTEMVMPLWESRGGGSSPPLVVAAGEGAEVVGWPWGPGPAWARAHAELRQTARQNCRKITGRFI